MIIQALVSFLISLVVTPFAMFLGRKFAIVDRPDGLLKTHQKVTPYLGGLAIYAGILPFMNAKLIALTSIMFVLGLLDDIKPIKWYIRLGVEFITGWFLSSILTHDLLTNIFYTFIFVLTVNATNMIDGMDGICAVVALIGMIFSVNLPFQWAVVGSVSGYLVYNFPPAKIFMGDAGSYLLGSIISYAILSNLEIPFSLNVFFPFWILFLDIFSSIVRRVIARKSPFEGDRDHIYDKIWRRIKGSKILKDRMTVLVTAVIAIIFAVLKYIESSILISLIGSIVVVLSLKMFWYDKGGKKNE